jgi:hypothetical protein
VVEEVLSLHGDVVHGQLTLVKRDQTLSKAIEDVEHRWNDSLVVAFVEGLHFDLLDLIQEDIHILYDLKSPEFMGL